MDKSNLLGDLNSPFAFYVKSETMCGEYSNKKEHGWRTHCSDKEFWSSQYPDDELCPVRIPNHRLPSGHPHDSAIDRVSESLKDKSEGSHLHHSY